MEPSQYSAPVSKYNPNERNLDAEALDPKDLIRLFEPNEGVEDAHNPNRQVCAFDRIAKAEGSYYLVAERGVGKTHILRLLSVILEKRGDLVIKIELKERSVYGAYLKLRKEFTKDKQRVLLWKIAILEEVAIALAEKYYKHNVLNTKKYLDKKIRNEFRKNFRDYIPDLFEYLKVYRKEDWINFKKIQHTIEKGAQTVVKTITTILSKINVSVTPVLRIGMSEPNVNTQSLTGDIDTQNLNSRLDRIEGWVWDVLSLLRSMEHTTYPEISHLTFALPNVHSVYVIADGLDQSTDPATRRDLLALTEATRDLNRKLIDKVPEGSPKNFKVITAFRAVTYYYYIEQRYPDMEQVRNHVEELRWSTPALKKMMARRIWESGGNHLSDSQSIDDKVDEIIAQRFPAQMHYFGKDFEPSVDFFFKLAGYRPRQIFQLWQDCAEYAGKKDLTFHAVLSEENIMDGFKKYSMGTLPKDIGEEYEIEYKGLRYFLNFLAANRDRITRIITTSELEKIIHEFLKTSEKSSKHLGQESIDIVNTMYRIGLIGQPVEHIQSDWVTLRHVYDDRNLDMQHYELAGFLPKMWNYLTNIRQDTLLRRDYSLKLYKSLKDITELLPELLTKPSNRLILEYQIGSFLVLGKLVKEFRRYPEPTDWRARDFSWNAITNSWTSLSEVTTQELGDNQKGLEKMDAIATALRPILLKTDDLFEFDLLALDEFQIKIADLPQYKEISEPLNDWYKLYADGKLPLITQRFIDSLNQGAGALTANLGEAIQLIDALTRYQDL